MNLIDFCPSDIEVGQPLKHSVFDRDGNLLLAQGNVVSEAAFERLRRLGTYKLILDEKPAPLPVSPSPPAALVPESAASGTRSRTSRNVDDDPTRVIVGAEAITSAALFRGWVDFMHMTDTRSGEPLSCRLSLLGVIDETSLMVTGPMLDQDWTEMEEGRSFDATIFNGRRIYTFETSILRRCDAPFPYLHLAFPQSVAERPVRRHLRAPVALEATLIHDGDQALESTSVMIVDLGMISAGVRSSNVRLQLGSPAALMFHLVTGAGDTVAFQLPAVVRRVHVHAKTATATYGLEFASIGETERQHLQSYVLRAAGAN